MPPRQALSRTFAPSSIRRSLVVALVVGTILNAINQGGALLAHQPLVWWKLGLTWLVPFVVASYGSYAAFRQQ